MPKTNNNNNNKEDDHYEEIYANEESEDETSESEELESDAEEEEDVQDVEEKLKWINGSFTAGQWKFKEKKPGPVAALNNSRKVLSPLDYFYKFIDLHLIKIIVKETNLYYKQAQKNKK